MFCDRCGANCYRDLPASGLCTECRYKLKPQVKSLKTKAFSDTKNWKRKRRENPTMLADMTHGAGSLGYHDPIAAAAVARRRYERLQDFKAQHGPVKVIMKNGKLVDNG